MSPLEISLRRTDDNRHPPWKSEHVIGSTMWQRRVQRSCVTLAVALLASVAGCSTSDGVPPPVPSDAGLLTFPRTATYFLFQHDLPTAQELAQYDVVVIDNEWGHRMPRDFFDDVRAANPRTRLLAYVNLIDHPDRLGSEEYWRNRYRLWQFDSHGESQFPDEWLAKRADGTVVSEWPDTSMSNLTDQGPRVDGLSFGRYAADWVVDTVWSQGVWDGIFLDVWGDRIYSADSDRWDIDRNGTDEADAQIYGEDMPWGRGIEEAERIMRDRMPTALLVANGDRTLRDRQLDGRAWENFADPRAERDPRFDIEQYIRLTARGDHREPGLAMTINKLGPQPNSERELTRARFFLTATLLQDGYWAPMGSDYGEPAYIDEMDGGGLGSGYLGDPIAPNPTLAHVEAQYSGTAGIGMVAPNVFRRDFDHGIVLVNSSDEPATVALGGTFRHLTGTADPETNDGSTTDRVTIRSYSGVVLLRNSQ